MSEAYVSEEDWYGMTRRFGVDPRPDVKAKTDEFVQLGIFYQRTGRAEVAFEAYRRAWELLLTSQPPRGRFHKGRELANMGGARLDAGDIREGFRWMLFAFLEDCLSRAEDSPTIQDELQWPAAQYLRRLGLTEAKLQDISIRTRRRARRRLVQDPTSIFIDEGFDKLVSGVRERPADVVRVFVSSPGDLRPERVLIADVCSDISSITGRDVRALLWEGAGTKHPESPPFQASVTGLAAQAVIDNEVWGTLGGYDVYVGMIWLRAGTPTGIWRSGTEAEYRYALDRHDREGRPREMLFYTKDVRKRGAREAGVDDFISDLRARRGLPQRFRSAADLRRMLVGHLARALRSL